MMQSQHKTATTTPAIRSKIAASDEPGSVFAARYGVAPLRFYESPYTELSDQGISGLYRSDDVQKIVAKVNEIKLAAVA